jgi:hypothetical protein
MAVVDLWEEECLSQRRKDAKKTFEWQGHRAA